MKVFEWAVIGAGPAGLLSVGKLLDQGIDPKSIAWIDPQFSVGDLGSKWRQVSSNTKVRLFLEFLNSSHAFRYQEAPDFSINHLNPTNTCDLYHIADPLQWISDHLVQQVTIYRDCAAHIELRHRAWQIELKTAKLSAKNAVLAIGAEPKLLSFVGPTIIVLQDALDSQRISSVCQKNDIVAVFGSSHSAILALKNLIDLGVKRVINFYLKPLRYAVEMDNWILFDDTGLKGMTAEWARQYLDGEWPDGLERLISSEEHLTQYLPECNKVIYAVGFEPRKLPVISGVE